MFLVSCRAISSQGEKYYEKNRLANAFAEPDTNVYFINADIHFAYDYLDLVAI